ncbi:hypothetical protein KFL_004530015 [Klebsormidium nitens]|uniref:Response regulatory domain-containing protein n=1 Tax=Klebsormidium nitens TaxID=105231 RepID=A0A1Y1IKT0_KLENI|nr:hypothetical protein KFL_004530015 [Klebsormidium nitens]|eukprot:GAQ88698.1 hypothetical protein KFL_004530015 [Klebsormidium nitens]
MPLHSNMEPVSNRSKECAIETLAASHLLELLVHHSDIQVPSLTALACTAKAYNEAVDQLWPYLMTKYEAECGRGPAAALTPRHTPEEDVEKNLEDGCEVFAERIPGGKGFRLKFEFEEEGSDWTRQEALMPLKTGARKVYLLTAPDLRLLQPFIVPDSMALHWKFKWKSEADEKTQLKARCLDLERKLAHAQMTLAVAQEQVAVSVGSKDEFTKRVAQHIRVPMHGIIQVCSSIIQDHGVLASTCSKVEIVCLTSTQVLSTLNELLQISSTENSRMCTENVAFNPRKLVDAVLKQVDQQVESKNVRVVQLVDGRTPTSLAGDMSRLRQALGIVLEVLLDAARDSEMLEIRVKPLHGDDPLLESMICSSRYISCLYELCLAHPAGEDSIMVRVGRDPDREDPQLIAVAGRLELMGWRLMRSVDSRAFQIIVHVKRALEGSGASQRYSLSRDVLLKERKLTILLMEENPIFRSTICQQLGQEGHTVDVVRNESEVCKLAEDGTIHLNRVRLRADRHYQRGQGPPRLHKATRRLMRCNKMPVVLMVGHGFEDWEVRYKEAGIDTYLLKPCTSEVLKSRIGDAISAATALVDIEELSEQSLSNESVLSQSELPLKQ